jgi:hypothetical protein
VKEKRRVHVGLSVQIVEAQIGMSQQNAVLSSSHVVVDHAVWF